LPDPACSISTDRAAVLDSARTQHRLKSGLLSVSPAPVQFQEDEAIIEYWLKHAGEESRSAVVITSSSGHNVPKVPF